MVNRRLWFRGRAAPARPRSAHIVFPMAEASPPGLDEDVEPLGHLREHRRPGRSAGGDSLAVYQPVLLAGSRLDGPALDRSGRIDGRAGL